MRFLIDNSLPPRMVQALAAAGHEAVHVRALNLASADDQAIFDAARQRDCVVLCEDTDFGTILATRQSNRPSVVLFRCRVKSVEALLPMLLANLPKLVTDIEAEALVVFQDNRIRVRRLPLVGG